MSLPIKFLNSIANFRGIFMNNVDRRMKNDSWTMSHWLSRRVLECPRIQRWDQEPYFEEEDRLKYEDNAGGWQLGYSYKYTYSWMTKNAKIKLTYIKKKK